MTSEPSLSFEAEDRLRTIVNRTTDLTPLKSVATKPIAIAEDERTAAMDLAICRREDGWASRRPSGRGLMKQPTRADLQMEE